ncbi:MAG: efflux RND transporter permease subunit, partial [Cyclobacteriaceae bacterium]
LGATHSYLVNFMFVVVMVAVILALLILVVRYYSQMLTWCLNNKKAFLSIPLIVLLWGLLSWQGFDKLFGFAAHTGNLIGLNLKQTSYWESLKVIFPGSGKEFMPPLDEGSYLLMPTTMPHSGISENTETIRLLDMRVSSIPEIASVVGKWGRVNSALDPAPISMFENTINYKPEYALDENGHRLRFKVDKEGSYFLKNGQKYNHKQGVFTPESVSGDRADTNGARPIEIREVDRSLVPDKNGEYFRNWRDHIESPEDIWDEIVKTTNIPGLTSAPKLQPIQTRLVMLSTGMRAPMGIKVFGPDLETIEQVGYELESWLKQVPSIKTSSVFADRVVGKPYLEIELNRDAIARYGLSIEELQMFIGVAIGGNRQTTTVEGRERYPVRVRYAREYRDNPEDMKEILIPTPSGAQIPLGQLAQINYSRGPQAIKSEDTFLVSYVIFDKEKGFAEVDVVEQAQQLLNDRISAGDLVIPAGVSYKFTGNYENQVRATKRLMIVIPISLITILLILYFQFGNVQTAVMVFTGVFVAFAGGFILIWLYGQDWFLNFSIAGESIRNLFQVHTLNLSVAVWVGFIALFGIASDNGVIMGTYLKQVFQRESPKTISDIKKSVLIAGQQRVRPAMMTTATTIIALLPVLTSTGKGSDIMVPMAIPTVGGMLIQMMTMFIVPVLYCAWQERKLKKLNSNFS